MFEYRMYDNAPEKWDLVIARADKLPEVVNEKIKEGWAPKGSPIILGENGMNPRMALVMEMYPEE